MMGRMGERSADGVDDLGVGAHVMPVTLLKSLWHRLLATVGVIGMFAGAYYYVTGEHLLRLVQHLR